MKPKGIDGAGMSMLERRLTSDLPADELSCTGSTCARGCKGSIRRLSSLYEVGFIEEQTAAENLASSRFAAKAAGYVPNFSAGGCGDDDPNTQVAVMHIDGGSASKSLAQNARGYMCLSGWTSRTADLMSSLAVSRHNTWMHRQVRLRRRSMLAHHGSR